MLALLSTKLWLALALAAALAFSHLFIYRAGKAVVRNEYLQAQIVADAESRRIEQRRQSMVVEAGAAAAKRETALRADARAARSVADGLRDDLSAARSYAAQSHAAAQRIADLSTELLDRCSIRYLGVAEAAQRADSEARELRQGWPR